MIELRVAGQFLLVGTILAYATLMRGLGQGTVGTVRFAQQVQQKRRQATFTAGASDFLQAASQADPQLQPDNTEAQVQAQAQAQPFTQSLINRGAESENLSFLSGFVKRTEPLIAPVAMPDQADMVAPDRIQGEMPPAELVERVQNIQLENPPDDAQIKVKIANVIKSRVDYASEVTAQTPTPAEESYENQLAMRGSEEATSWRESALNSFGDERLMNPDSAAFEDNFAQALNLEWDEAAPHDLARPHPVLTAAAASARKVVNHQPRKTLQASTRATAEAQPALQFDDKMTSFELPPLALLADASEVVRHHLSDEALEENARMLESVLDDYGVKGDIVSVRPGPVVTMYELEPAPGLKASRVIGLADDIARSM
ncbi:MAG: DNA translocase FtsK, partial [Rhodobacterales bacterium]